LALRLTIVCHDNSDISGAFLLLEHRVFITLRSSSAARSRELPPALPASQSRDSAFVLGQRVSQNSSQTHLPNRNDYVSFRGLAERARI
jgi:hypothetical protein